MPMQTTDRSQHNAMDWRILTILAALLGLLVWFSPAGLPAEQLALMAPGWDALSHNTVSWWRQVFVVSGPDTSRWLVFLLHLVVYTTLAWCVVDLCHQLGGSQSAQRLCLLLLALHPLYLNERQLIPDAAVFWCFAILSLRPLRHYCRSPQPRYLLQWLGCLGLASFARAEALLLILLMPAVMLRVTPRRQRRQAAINLLWGLVLFAALVFGTGLFGWLATHTGSPLSALLNDAELVPLQQLLMQSGIQAQTGWMAAGAAAAQLLYTLLTILGWPLALLLLVTLLFDSAAKNRTDIMRLTVLLSACSLAAPFFAILLGTQANKQDLGLAAIVLIPLLAIGGVNLWQRINIPLRTAGVAIIGSWGFLNASLLLQLPAEEEHLPAANQWLDEQAAGSQLLTNQPRLAWLTGSGARLQSLDEIVGDMQFGDAQWLALSVTENRFSDLYPLARDTQIQFAAQFKNDAGDYLMIFSRETP